MEERSRIPTRQRFEDTSLLSCKRHEEWESLGRGRSQVPEFPLLVWLLIFPHHQFPTGTHLWRHLRVRPLRSDPDLSTVNKETQVVLRKFEVVCCNNYRKQIHEVSQQTLLSKCQEDKMKGNRIPELGLLLRDQWARRGSLWPPQLSHSQFPTFLSNTWEFYFRRLVLLLSNEII